MKPFSDEWIAAYYDAIMLCVDRYRDMIATRNNQSAFKDVAEFLDEFNREVPLLKLDRWLGYVQCALCERGATSVQAERDWTRPLFRSLDFA